MTDEATERAALPADEPHDGSADVTRKILGIRRAVVHLLEFVASVQIFAIVALLLVGVVSRYVFHHPIVWVDELSSLLFIWAVMIGAVLALDRHEHMRLTVFLDMMPQAWRGQLATLSLLAVIAFLAILVVPAYEYVGSEWFITSPTLGIPNSFRVAAIFFGIVAMLLIVLMQIASTSTMRQCVQGVIFFAAVAALFWFARPVFDSLGNYNILIFMVGLVVVCMAIGTPIAFCFGLATASFLLFTTSIPTSVVIGRMDEGMSALVLISVPIFVLLGYILDSTGMGKAIVDCLASLIGHIRGGMSYVLLGSLFLVSGISGSKVADMATVAPALFPEMRKRGNKDSEMIALLSTGAAMADTVPPSIVLIVVGSVTGVSIAALFSSGLMVALFLLLVLCVLARLRTPRETLEHVKRPTLRFIGKVFLIAAPALLLPFLIRGAVSEGIATTTEVSTIAVLYAYIAGMLLYGGISAKRSYGLLVETAVMSGAIMLIMGTAQAMAWALTQTGFAMQMSMAMTSLPGGWITFMLISIATFIILGCLLEGIPAIVLLGPLMFPIAAQIGISDVQYAMVAVVAMNVGLMAPPIGVGFYVACSIGKVNPNHAMRAIWPYLAAMVIGLLAVAFIPAISLWILD
ncbi:MAG: TRAP transporter large permease subunit [Aquamicrobium sp.]|nr:TRAP transporter large permease subunit [Aquamicrobium sp.]